MEKIIDVMRIPAVRERQAFKMAFDATVVNRCNKADSIRLVRNLHQSKCIEKARRIVKNSPRLRWHTFVFDINRNRRPGEVVQLTLAVAVNATSEQIYTLAEDLRQWVHIWLPKRKRRRKADVKPDALRQRQHRAKGKIKDDGVADNYQYIN